ncbi:MAG TPA: Na+/H+ antiporter subunit E [Rubrivivax sp.]|jgi:multicomponent K+:H+ antiporter subunit E|nr:Na+/H+ antiporter subunit E [Rubrivivax sp.]
MKPPARPGGDAAGWLPHPVLSVVLALVWLLLQQSLAPAHLLSAAVLALALPRLLHGFIGDSVHPRSPRTMLHLLGVVLWDIVMSNITVARIVISPASDPQPAWVEVPLEAEHPTVVALLAAIITMTPGTVSCVVDEQRRSILVHALDCSDAADMAAQIKQRYEAPLRRIFEGVRT